MDFHAEAQQRFTSVTEGVVERGEFRYKKELLVAEFIVDALETRAFLTRGICHEIDPVAQPFVRSNFRSVLGVSLIVLGSRVVPNTRLGNKVLDTTIQVETLNLIRNHERGCE